MAAEGNSWLVGKPVTLLPVLDFTGYRVNQGLCVPDPLSRRYNSSKSKDAP
jgi:hypothetical protein